jgi:hypothetical protein
MLPKVVAHARILRYGYESAWFGENRIITAPRIVSQRLLDQLLPEREVASSPKSAVYEQKLMIGRSAAKDP